MANFNLRAAETSVRKMMEAYGQVGRTSEFRNYEDGMIELFKFRSALIKEEFEETVAAIKSNDIVEFVDGLLDMLVVSMGACIALGLDTKPTRAIDMSNSMTSMAGGVTGTENNQAYTTFEHLSNDVQLLNAIDSIIVSLERHIKEFVDASGESNLHTSPCQFDLYDINRMFENLHASVVVRVLFLSEVMPGLNLQKNFSAIMKSNMAKFCSSVEEAERTVEKYKSQGIDTFYEEVKPGMYRVKRRSDGKMLKSISWKEHKIKINQEKATQ